MGAIDAFWRGALEALLRTLWEGSLLAVALFALARLFPRIPARVRAGGYWLICLRFLIGALVPFAVALPLLPAPRPAQPEVFPPLAPHVLAQFPPQLFTQVPPQVFAQTPSPGFVFRAPPSVAAPTAPAPAPFPWEGLLWAVWLVGVAVALERRVVQHRQVRALLASARPLEDRALSAIASGIAHRLRLRRLPALFSSSEISTPLVTGLRRPRVVLPDSLLARGDADALRMAIAHELAHLARRDLWAAWVPAFAEALFWFFPPVRWCAREYAQAREEACDVEALAATGAAPGDYGQLLLSLGVARKAVAVSAACGASPHFHHLRRRLLMLQHATYARKSRLWWLAPVIGAFALVPFRVVAREATPHAVTAPAPAAPAADAMPPAPPPPPTPGARAIPPVPPPPPASHVQATPPTPPTPPTPDEDDGAVPSIPPVPAFPQMPPIPPFPPMALEFDGLTYVLVDGDSTTMSGLAEDFGRVQSLKGKYGEHFLWVRKDGKEYVLTDPALLAPLHALTDKQKALGEAQGKLGDQQGKLGDQQGTLGDKQGELGEKMGELGAKMGEIASERVELALNDHDEKDQKVEARRAELDRQMRQLEKQMHVLAQQQGALGRQQGELARKQAEFGREQAKAARLISKAVRKMIDHAVKDGTAHPLE